MPLRKNRTFPTFPNVSDLPGIRIWTISISAKTIQSTGTKFHKLPDTKGSHLWRMFPPAFVEPADITQYGIMYGGVQRISDRQV